MAVRNTSGSSDYSVSTVTLRQSGSAARFTMTLDAKAKGLNAEPNYRMRRGINNGNVINITAVSSILALEFSRGFLLIKQIMSYMTLSNSY